MDNGSHASRDLHALLHPDEQQRFRRLCLETSPEELRELTELLSLHLHQVETLAGPNTDVETARTIAHTLTRLLSTERTFDADQRRQIRGAVEYFLLTEDADSDLDHPLGFDDDLRVVNTVLVRIGRPELIVDVPC